MKLFPSVYLHYLFLQMIYKNGKNIQDFLIPGCEFVLCPLEIFRIVLKNSTLENFDEDCGKRGFYPIIEGY